MTRRRGCGRHHTERAVSALYEAVTGPIIRADRESMACHFGLWRPDTTSYAQALSRALSTLVQGCNLGPGQRVLDAGLRGGRLGHHAGGEVRVGDEAGPEPIMSRKT